MKNVILNVGNDDLFRFIMMPS